MEGWGKDEDRSGWRGEEKGEDSGETEKKWKKKKCQSAERNDGRKDGRLQRKKRTDGRRIIDGTKALGSGYWLDELSRRNRRFGRGRRERSGRPGGGSERNGRSGCQGRCGLGGLASAMDNRSQSEPLPAITPRSRDRRPRMTKTQDIPPNWPITDRQIHEKTIRIIQSLHPGQKKTKKRHSMQV